MKEQIFKIITDNHGTEIAFSEDARKTAKEIAEHFEKFITWTNQECPFWYEQVSNTWLELSVKDDIDKTYTLKELYSYWIKGINNK